MADADSWSNVETHGLLSTTALLDLFEVNATKRRQIESCRRAKPITITHPKYGTAVIRDQGPMSDKKLADCLTGMTPREWYELLNRKTFFWLTEPRLETLMKSYPGTQLVLEVDSASFLDDYERKIELSSMNSGSTSPYAHPRCRDTFRSFSKYDFTEQKRRKGGPSKAVVEVTVDYSVPDIQKYVVRARKAILTDKGLRTVEVLYAR